MDLRIGSLFSGIGGLELGLEMSGVGSVVWQVEKDPFCRSVLEKHWPVATRFGDIKEVGKGILAPVDLICGGFPCQDISSAGKGAGLAGERSGLWFEFARTVEEMEPKWVVVENVASGAQRWVDAVSAHLEQLGYEVLPVPLSAQDVGAPHLRRRIFLVAHSYGLGLAKREGKRQGFQPERKTIKGMGPARFTANSELPAVAGHGGWGRGPTISPVCRMDDGIPHRLERLRALGNAVVPQCAEVVGWVIRELTGDSP